MCTWSKGCFSGLYTSQSSGDLFWLCWQICFYFFILILMLMVRKEPKAFGYCAVTLNTRWRDDGGAGETYKYGKCQNTHQTMSSVMNNRCHKLTTVLLKMQVFLDVVLCHWVRGSQCLKARAVLETPGTPHTKQNITSHKTGALELTCILWYWHMSMWNLVVIQAWLFIKPYLVCCRYYLNGKEAKLNDFVSPNVLNVLACQITAVRNTTAGIHLPMWLSE